MSKSLSQVKSDLIKARLFWFLLCDAQETYMDEGIQMPDSLLKCRLHNAAVLNAAHDAYENHTGSVYHSEFTADYRN